MALTSNTVGCDDCCPRPTDFDFVDRCIGNTMQGGSCLRAESVDTGDVYDGCADGAGHLTITMPSGQYLITYGKGGCADEPPRLMNIVAGSAYRLGINCGRGYANIIGPICCGKRPSTINISGPGGYSMSGPGTGFRAGGMTAIGNYTVSTPSTATCNGGSSVYPLTSLCPINPPNWSPPFSLKPEFVCCSDISLSKYTAIPRNLIATNGLGVANLVAGGGFGGGGWGGCAFGQPSEAGVDDDFVNTVEGTIGWSDQRPTIYGSGCMPKADDGCKDTLTQWLKRTHTKKSGTTGISYDVGCNMDGGLTITAHWNYNWSNAYDYREGINPLCSTCPQWIEGVQYWVPWKNPAYPDGDCSGPKQMEYDDHREWQNGFWICIRTNAPDRNDKRHGFYKTRTACNQIGQEYGPFLEPLPTYGTAFGSSGPLSDPFTSVTIELEPPYGWEWTTEVEGDGYSPDRKCPPPPGGTSVTISAA